MKENLKIIIVEDNEIFRKGLKTFLTLELKHFVIEEAENGVEAINLVSKINFPDIVIMDINMAKMDGIETTKILTQKYPSLKILALTMHSEKLFLVELVKAGFYGCINKREYFIELPKAIKLLKKGEMFFPQNMNIIKD